MKNHPSTEKNLSCPVPRRGVHLVSAFHIPKPGEPAIKELCQVVEEDALTIDIEGIGKYTLMWTPTEKVDGAIGFTDVDGILGESEECNFCSITNLDFEVSIIKLYYYLILLVVI